MDNHQIPIKITGLKHLWQTKEIHVLMLSSLLIQVTLTFCAPLRKRRGRTFLHLMMFLLYLAADAVALYTIGLISRTISANGSKMSHEFQSNGAQNPDLLAFWAPFLLLHLGGPDTITALALQDNELWPRHAIQLATQVTITVYVFMKSFWHHHLWLPALLVFIDGTIKYIERTCALYYASSANIRDSLSRIPQKDTPNYTRLMEEYSSARNANIPTKLQVKDKTEIVEDPIPPNATENWSTVKETDDMVGDAYDSYMKVKGLLADAYLSLKDRGESRAFFLGRPASEATRIVEIELNLFYDVLYTKAFLLRRKTAYVRLVCFLCIVASLVLFSASYVSNTRTYQGLDVVVTFFLLGVAIVLDICAFLMFVLSDWWIIIMDNDSTPKFIQLCMKWLLSLSRFMKHRDHKRWSQSISSYNLLTCCFRDPPAFVKYVYISGIKDILNSLLYVESSPFDKQLIMKFIAEELQSKAKQAKDVEAAKEVCSARGNLVFNDEFYLASEYLNSGTNDADFDASLLTWHVATDICYWSSTNQINHDDKTNLDFRSFSKQISDYISFLLIKQQELVSPIMGLGTLRFQDTCKEAKRYTDKKLDPWYSCIFSQNEKQLETKKLVFSDFCKKVKEEAEFRRTIGVSKGDRAQSVLFDACYLAQRLDMFGERQWEITSKVWVELLSYAATRCSPRSHIAQLSKGGELLTVVWLLMAHFGLGDRFMQTQGFRWSKLVIPK